MNGLFGGGGKSTTTTYSPKTTSGSGTGGTTYEPKYQGAADKSYTDILDSLISGGMGLSGISDSPGVKQLGNESNALDYIINNPGQQYATDTANYLGPLATDIGNTNINTGSTLRTAGLGALPYAEQIASTAFDPQSALYGRERQKESDTAGATNAMYGLSGTPYGAGVRNKALSDFDIDWQDKQLKRQLYGIEGYGTGVKTAADTSKTAAGLETTGLGQEYWGGTLPYETYKGYGTDQQKGISDYLTNANLQYYLPSLDLKSAGNYLGLGTDASKALTSGSGYTTTADTTGDSSTALSGFGSFLGGAGLGGLAFGSGGLAGSLGLGDYGLLGNYGSGSGLLGWLNNTGMDYTGTVGR